MRLYKQKFYRIMTGGRRAKTRQDIEVEVEVSESDDIAACKKKARAALYARSDSGFKSGWTPWFEGRHQTVELEYVSDENVDEETDVGHEDVVEHVVDEQEAEMAAESAMLEQEAEMAAESAMLEEQMREDMEGAGLDPDEPEDVSEALEIVALDPNKGEVPPHERGEAIERLKPFSRFKIKNVYDRPEFPVDAVQVLQPGFEYPDWEDERVNKLWKR